MAVSRGGVAFWVGCVRSHSRRQPFRKRSWTQAMDLQWIPPARSLSSASWALAPPNSLRYQSFKQPVLSHPFSHGGQKAACYGEHWEESVDVCVMVRQGEPGGLHTLEEIRLLSRDKLSELLGGAGAELWFPLTTVDGRREDDISVHGSDPGAPALREHGCFRSLFEVESCPAPFTEGSRFYCFHSPGTDRASRAGPGLLPLLHPASLCSRPEKVQGEGAQSDWEGEEKLAAAFEKLRVELPNFFLKSHDYTIYSKDVEFINGLLNTKTRGRVVYQLTLSLWRLLCMCYYADVHLEVLKLTKHMEDGTVKARWRLRGLPFHTLVLRFYRKDKSHLYRSYDAFSTFSVAQDGLIHCHKVEKVIPARPPVLPRATSLLAGALVALGFQENRPALNLLPLLLSSLRQTRD